MTVLRAVRVSVGVYLDICYLINGNLNIVLSKFRNRIILRNNLGNFHLLYISEVWVLATKII